MPTGAFGYHVHITTTTVAPGWPATMAHTWTSGRHHTYCAAADTYAATLRSTATDPPTLRLDIDDHTTDYVHSATRPGTPAAVHIVRVTITDLLCGPTQAEHAQPGNRIRLSAGQHGYADGAAAAYLDPATGAEPRAVPEQYHTRADAARRYLLPDPAAAYRTHYTRGVHAVRDARTRRTPPAAPASGQTPPPAAPPPTSPPGPGHPVAGPHRWTVLRPIAAYQRPDHPAPAG